MPQPQFESTIKKATISVGAHTFFDGQGMFYWDEEMAADEKHAKLRAQLTRILRVATENASVFLTVRYCRTGRTVASMRLSHEDGWLKYSIASSYYLKVTNEHDERVVVEFNPFKGIELVTSSDCHFESYF